MVPIGKSLHQGCVVDPREEVCLAIELAAQNDVIVCMNQAGKVLDEKEFAFSNSLTFFERCEGYLKQFFELCENKQRSVVAIGVSIQKEAGCLDGDSEKSLKGQLERRYQLCTEVLANTSVCEGGEQQVRLASIAKSALERKKIESLSGKALSRTLLSADANLFVVTGRPASGKTTFIASVVGELRQKNILVGGMTSLEVKASSTAERTGFCMRLLSIAGSDTEVELARVGSVPGWVRFSRFSVCVDNIDTIAVPFLERVAENAEVIVIDEVASMQMLSQKFQEVLKKMRTLKLPIIISVTESARYEEITQLKAQVEKDGALIILDPNDKPGSQQQARDIMMPRLYQLVQQRSTKKSI